MNNIKYHLEIGTKVAYKKSIMEAKNGLGNKDIKRYAEDCFLFEIWFVSNR